MRCLAPLTMFRRVGVPGVRFRPQSGDHSFSVPCGTCVSCLLRRSREWAVRCLHERQSHERACFVTLTYDEEHLPYANSLVKEHSQEFMRSLRLEFEELIRFLSCGEYGSRFARPHYHFILFGVDFHSDRYIAGRRGGEDVYRSPTLERVWTMGRSEIGSATFASACYVARYVASKIDSRVLAGREPEFLLSSLKPGLGALWIAEHWEAVYARDSVIVSGVELPPPRYYDKFVEKFHPVAFARVKVSRERARLPVGEDPDDCSSRWSVIEECLRAKLNLFAREVEV